MDGSIIGMIIALTKKVPDTAAQRAEAAAQSAEGYAEVAQLASIGAKVENHKLIITAEVSNNA